MSNTRDNKKTRFFASFHGRPKPWIPEERMTEIEFLLRLTMCVRTSNRFTIYFLFRLTLTHVGSVHANITNDLFLAMR